jgi:DNA-binding NarL/FixJ family response regulator
MKILLADDSELILERLQDLIKKYKEVEIVGAFNNGYDTLEGLRNLKPDLAIVDIQMPGLNGLEILGKIKQEQKNITFIILTFYDSDFYKLLALDLGTDYYFSKVYDFEKISSVVEKMLAKEKILFH